MRQKFHARHDRGHEPLAPRLTREAHIDPATGCWLWIKSCQKHGYGRIRAAGKTKLVHRVSWETFRGEIPSELMVLHTCDVRNCFNPDHLYLGTAADNTNDMLCRGRTRIAMKHHRLSKGYMPDSQWLYG